MAHVTAPRFAVLRGETRCYRCDAPVTVAGLAAPPEAVLEENGEVINRAHEHGWVGLSEIEELPERVLRPLLEVAPGYRKDHSVTAGFAYLLNHCSACDAKQGDWYLHKPGGPFSAEEPERLQVWVLDYALVVDASFSEGPLGDWLAGAVSAP